MNSLTFTIAINGEFIHAARCFIRILENQQIWCTIPYLVQVKRNQHKLFSVSKMIRQTFRARSTDHSDSICRFQWLFAFCNRQNTLKLFQKFMLREFRMEYETRTTIFIIAFETKIYYLLNIGECLCVWCSVFMSRHSFRPFCIKYWWNCHYS